MHNFSPKSLHGESFYCMESWQYLAICHATRQMAQYMITSDSLKFIPSDGPQQPCWTLKSAICSIDTQAVRCRFYIMRLPGRGLAFDRITYHSNVTQCLGGLGDKPWYMAVARPTGSVDEWPQLSDLQAFR